MEFKFGKFNDEEIEVTFPQVNGYDWVIFRRNSGTYAEYAKDDGTEVNIVIEEFSDPERRRMWDEYTDEEILGVVYEEIIDSVI